MSFNYKNLYYLFVLELVGGWLPVVLFTGVINERFKGKK